MFNSNSRLLLLIVLAIAGLAGIFLIFDLGVIKWFTCSAPFADSQDKASDLCRKLESVP